MPEAAWSKLEINYGQTEDRQNDVVVRSALDKGEDLKDFLNTIAGYLPFPYLTEKIVEGTTKLQDVWDIIYEHYGITVTAESMLDYVAIQMNSGESYRQFFDRLLSHARLHLPKANVTVDGIDSGTNGEKMTISLMNFVALDWLTKINPHLVNIVKTEYSKELRDNTQLCQLVPRIANNVDALLSRHDVIGGIEQLWLSNSSSVEKVNRIREDRRPFSKKSSNKFPARSSKMKLFCPECHFLGRKLKLNIGYQHTPANCPRPRSAVNMLLAGEELLVQNTEAAVDEDDIDDQPPPADDNCESYDFIDEINSTELYSKILVIQKNIRVRKEYSPQLRTKIGSIIADSIIDEGSELNCICSSVAAQCNIRYNPAKITAMSAGSNVMRLLGVVPSDIELLVYESKTPIKIILKNAVVVKNLGPKILIGEPAKMDNDIRTLPKQKLIQLVDVSGKWVQLPYRSHRGTPAQKYQAYAVKTDTILYPADSMQIPIQPSMQCSAVSVTMRKPYNFCKPSIQNANKGHVLVSNDSDKIVYIKKNDHLADLRICEPIESNLMDIGDHHCRKIYDISREDLSHLQQPIPTATSDESFIKQISIDPDNQMSAIWKKRFQTLCSTYSDTITPIPGRYNGAFGRTSTDINFVSTPPSNLKTYLPKYSQEMMQTLADKMDVLESWGVLRPPEDLGIIPEFVSPSLLTPKPEKNEFRLVTDFTSLNKYIKKLPTISPSIQDAKEKIAKFKHHAFLDLSNYYYQGGVKIEDSQFLATVHPFKGLRVYTVEPQGLLNSGEHAYERLARIYGDLCATKK